MGGAFGAALMGLRDETGAILLPLTAVQLLWVNIVTDGPPALAQTIAYVERSKAFMPPGTVNPFVVRFDAGSVPVGQLVFSSETRGVAEISDLALFRVRPAFSTLPGVSAPPPFGGNQRTVVVRVEPDRLRAYGMTPEEVVRAIATGNTILPAGSVRIGDYNRIAPLNSIVSNIQELAGLPLRVGSGPNVYLRDVGTVENGSDILTGYGLVNGRRTVYIPVTKRSDASTLDVVNRVKAELSRFQSLVPDDIKVSFEFDQSTYVKNAISGLAFEGALGAILTGLMVLLFLRDVRSALVVVLTIPFALLAALVGLWLTRQTVNIMTLGGLALAVVVILLLLTAYFQSLRVALVVLAAISAVVAGVALALWLTRTTLNVLSYMGAIMAIGVSVANAILLVAVAETHRRAGLDAFKAAVAGATSRLRAILMTSFAMIAGMLPMALAFGEGGAQTAPLGRAVIGGLAASTIAVLTVLPAVFAIVQRRASTSSHSIHPYDAQKPDEQQHSGNSMPIKDEEGA